MSEPDTTTPEPDNDRTEEKAYPSRLPDQGPMKEGRYTEYFIGMGTVGETIEFLAMPEEGDIAPFRARAFATLADAIEAVDEMVKEGWGEHSQFIITEARMVNVWSRQAGPDQVGAKINHSRQHRRKLERADSRRAEAQARYDAARKGGAK